MKKSIEEMQAMLIDLLKAHYPILKATIDTAEKFEVTGTIEAMQGKKKVDGFYFSSVVPKPKDVRFYFFPMYTHREELFDGLSDELKKFLKGKSCFHIKNISEEMAQELVKLISKAVKLYQRDGYLQE